MVSKVQSLSLILSLCTCMCVCSVMSNSLQPMDYSLPRSSVHGIFQAEILEWVPHFLLQGNFLTQRSNLSLVPPSLSGGFFTTAPPRKTLGALKTKIKLLS